MKKMSKKLVSLLTILAFMATALLPSVAFADSNLLTAKADKGSNFVVVEGTFNKDDMLVIKDKDTDAAVTDAVTFKNEKEETKVEKLTLKTGVIGRDTKLKAVLTNGESAIAESDVAIEPIPEEKQKEFNNSGSYAFFKDADKTEGVEADANEIIEDFVVEFSNKDGRPAKYDGPLYIWAEADKNQPDSRFRIEDGEDVLGGLTIHSPLDYNIYKIDNVVTDDYGDGVTFNVKFTASGDYRVYVSTVDPRGSVKDGKFENVKDDGSFKSAPAKFNAEGHKNVAHIGGQDQTVSMIGVKDLSKKDAEEHHVNCGDTLYETKEGTGTGKCCDLNDIDEHSFVDYVLVDPNDTTKTNLEAYIYTKDDKGKHVRVGKGKEVKISTNSNAITVDPDKTATDRRGRVEFSITGKAEGEYLVYVESGNCGIIIPVKVTPLRANDIEKMGSPEAPIAAEDSSADPFLSFRILDKDGNIVRQPFAKGSESAVLGLDGLRGQMKELSGEEGDNIKKEYLHGPIYDVAYDGDFLRINEKPAKSKLKIKDIFIQGADDSTGAYVIGFKKDLIPGKYEIEVRLDNGDKATFNFEVKNFGKAKELKISYPQRFVELGYKSGIADIKFVDENGVEKSARKYVTLGANGYAVEKFDRLSGEVRVKNDEKYLGDTITVTAVAEKEGLVADTELVVTDGKGGNETLAFDKKSGPVNRTNRVNIQVVDAKGNKIALGEDKVVQSMSAVVTEKGEADANVSANISTANKASLKENGTAELTLKSDKATSADVKVTIVAQAKRKGAIHTAYYRGTLHYVFSDKEQFAGRVVVMTINSNQVIVDNNIVTIDTAAIIKNERTFVPFRALAEAFGAKVEYKDGVVTAELEDKKVEMTVDKKEYKMNGKDASMDVAPFIQDSRAMIPIRFAAEALGFKVTPTYHANGTTASVAFQK